MFKSTDSTEYISSSCQTEKTITINQGMNTVDLFTLETQNRKNSANNLLLNDLDKSNSNQKSAEMLRNSNLFLNLDN